MHIFYELMVMIVQSDVSMTIDTPLVGNYLDRLLRIINEFSRYFITGTATSTVNIGSMSIKLKSSIPVYNRSYQLSHAETIRGRDIITDLLEKQIIKECSFLATTIEYLGRTISKGQDRPSRQKVRALIDSAEQKKS